MEIEFDKADLMINREGTWLTLHTPYPGQAQKFLSVAKPAKYIAELKQKRNRRSLDANAYCWIMCQKIAEAIGSSKEGVYKDAVRSVGQFDILLIKNETVNDFAKHWSARGLGWFCGKLDERGKYTQVAAYYGSSTYDTAQMSALIDYLVRDAEELGIPTATSQEIALLKERWGDAQADKSRCD